MNKETKTSPPPPEVTPTKPAVEKPDAPAVKQRKFPCAAPDYRPHNVKVTGGQKAWAGF